MLLSKAELELGKLAEKNGSSRYDLKAIAVEHEETVVTNGHYLVAVKHGALVDDNYPVTAGLEHAQPNGKAILVSSTAAIAASKALPKKNTIPILGSAALGKDGKVYVNDLDNVQSFFGETPGTFPNWKAVLPKTEPTCVFGVNADYLRLLADFISKHGKDVPVITVTVYDKDSAIKLEAETNEGQGILALVMPVRL